ncbi:MAG: AAA domain-containing protein [Hyphomicrobiaceae bacterium]
MSFKTCPDCGEQRPHHEVFCQTFRDERTCGWDLTTVTLDVPRPEAQPQPPEPICVNGHRLNPGDLLCGECGGDMAADDRLTQQAPPGGFGEQPQSDYEPPIVTTIEGWEVLARMPTPGTLTEVFQVRGPEGVQGILTLYPCGVKPDAAVDAAVEALSPNAAARIAARGAHEGRAFEVAQTSEFRTFADVALRSGEMVALRDTVRAVGHVLHAVSRAGIRHRDLRPEAIIPGEEPSTFALCRFGCALLSSHDLDTATPHELTRYMAPEVLAGAVSPASDWWSVGIILLEKLTQGACFEGISDQAFLMNVVANGADIPAELDEVSRLLLRGLLVRDRTSRWKWEEVEAWANGEPVQAPDEDRPINEPEAGSIILGGRTFRSPSKYALAVASRENWAEARDQLARGVVATWLEEFPTADKMRSAIRTVMRREGIDDDTRLSVALKILNPVMPLVRAGEIITSHWLLQYPVEGYSLITGGAPDLLEQLGLETWLAQLQRRASDVRRRAELLDIELVDDMLRINILCTSRISLDALWDDQRTAAPDSDHKGVASLMDRPQLTDVDLIVLLSASGGQFRPLQEVLQSASELARREGISTFEETQAVALFQQSRREVLRQVGERLENFSRCGINRVDEWADQFRLERRTSLARAAVMLSIPQARWKRPPGQEYVSQLLGFFEKRINVSVSRGALARMTITKTSPRIDLTELGTQREGAARLLDQLLERSDIGVTLDPSLFAEDPAMEHRLRTLVSRAELLRRETGINGLYMGFPFILTQPRSEAVKPRIAPVLLWPIKIGTEVGQRARFTLGFDRDREEVRVNPALQNLFTPQELLKWEAARDNILAGASSATSVMDELAHLSNKVRQGPLAKLPGPDVKVNAGAVTLLPAAVLFHVTFVGQAIVEDIRQLRAIPPEGSSLETLLRVQDGQKKANSPPLPGDDLDRYATAESDPTQDRAVVQARCGPGLVIEGPPGTGKSQTIVNMVADAIGRKKSILIICQKQAALDVVCKRLQREGLDDRLVMVSDLVKDRRPVIEAIRVQVEGILLNGAPDTTWQRQRRAVLERIKRFEDQLNTHQESMHEREEVSGLTFRELVSELVTLEDGGTLGDCLELRELFGRMNAERVGEISETCAGIGRLWLPSEYEKSALASLKPFGWDSATINRFHKDLEQFCDCERRRPLVAKQTPTMFEVDDAAGMLQWLAKSRDRLAGLKGSEAEELAYFVELFVAFGPTPPVGPQFRQQLSAISNELASNPGPQVAFSFDPLIARQDEAELVRWIAVAARATHPASLVRRLSFGRYLNRRRVKKLLQLATPIVDDALMTEFLSQARHEKMMRGIRARISQIYTALGFSPVDLTRATSGDLFAHADWLSATLDRVASLAALIVASPVGVRTLAAAKDRKTGALNSHFEDIAAALARCAARNESLSALAQLERWCEPRWVTTCRDSVAKNTSTTTLVAPIVGALATLPAYQQFRVRADRLSPDVHAVLAAMRSLAPELRAVDTDDLEAAIRRLLRREACLGWKAGFESVYPILLVEYPEVEGLVRSLAEAEAELRAINKRAITTNIDPRQLGSRDKWEDITRFTGPRARRLREFVEAGWDIGLKEVRPVWLMGPDVASRMLPIRQMFDTVVYDEASQMPVEFALPSLFRGKAVIVSGDDKQLPPTSFFANRVDSDEDEAVEFDEGADDLDEDDKRIATETWNRREIKDCPNLLDLSKSVLPKVMLQVHYRSAFRELISFSNNAFYGGDLNVPVRHPEAEVDREKPLEVVRVDGLYDQRTNGEEAARVVELLASIWKKDTNPPSIGVVTFNRDQADLIELRLEERAEEDAKFRAAYSRELNRTELGEDMRFFVKNVENVQGDERDQIIFSTTFGYNRARSFRRNFGVLGQSGGERRLNVAVTRARKKITLVTSMPIDLISDVMSKGAKPERPKDFLQLYLAYATALSRGDHGTSAQYLKQVMRDPANAPDVERACQDGLATSVAAYVRSLGIDPTPANDGSAFGIDFAIRHPRRGTYGIGIECDGHLHPILTRARAREIWRRSVMRKSIPVIHRVSLRGWYHDRASEQARLRNAIEQALK